MIIEFSIKTSYGGTRPDMFSGVIFERLETQAIQPYRKNFYEWQWRVFLFDDFDYDSFNQWISNYANFLKKKRYVMDIKWNKL